MRRVCYVSGTRADFGLMARALDLAQRSGRVEVSVCVTGAHLSPAYGATVHEIEATGLRIAGRVPVNLDGTTGAVMAKALGAELIGITEILERDRPDLVLVLGDRSEMLAGALAAIHLNIPVAHVHGGERSGTVDEPIRHAISKLSHIHLVATTVSRERLIRMGELAENIIVTGAPGLDGIKSLVQKTRAELCDIYGLQPDRPISLILYHAVLQEAGEADRQMQEIMEAVKECDVQVLALMPNSDAGGQAIGQVLQRYASQQRFRVVTHLERSDFLSWMAAADVMVGNSSSGIIEAASLGLRVVNVGDRQRLRERNENTLDVPPDAGKIAAAIRSSLAAGRSHGHNVYGDDGAAARIVDALVTLPITPELLNKANAY